MKKVTLMLSVLVLGAVTAFAGTISVPQWNDTTANTDANLFPPSDAAAFINLKNNTGTTQTYTVLYYSLTGTNRTPTANTFTLGANAAVGWRPVANDPNEGPVGQSVPNALTTGTGSPTAGTATILYSDSVAPSGRVVEFHAYANATYAYALYPAP